MCEIVHILELLAIAIISATMNTNEFELVVAHNTPGLSLRWIMTSDGLRMQWTPRPAQMDARILILPTPVAEKSANPPAAA
jgi:hypothetical protein